MEDLTQRLQATKETIVQMVVQKEQDETVLFDLQTEKALLIKERESIQKTLVAIDADLKEISSAEASLQESTLATTKEIARLTETEYDVLKEERAQAGLPPLSLLQEDIERALSKRLAEKRTRIQDDDPADSYTFPASASSGKATRPTKRKKKQSSR